MGGWHQDFARTRTLSIPRAGGQDVHLRFLGFFLGFSLREYRGRGNEQISVCLELRCDCGQEGF